MDDVAAAHSENEEAKKIRERILRYESGENPLAPIEVEQQEIIDKLEQLMIAGYYNADDITDDEVENKLVKEFVDIPCKSFKSLYESEKKEINSALEFLNFYDEVSSEMDNVALNVYNKYIEELKGKSSECDEILNQIDGSLLKINQLSDQYELVETKTSSLNNVTEKLTEEQDKLEKVSIEIQRRLYYFNQADSVAQKLQNPNLSVTSETFRDLLNKIDECLEYLRQNPKFKESGVYIVKYKHCLSKALTMIKNYSGQILSQASESVLSPKSPTTLALSEVSSPETAFALYYGKFQTSSIKIKKISSMIEERIGQNPEYEQLLAEIHQNYLSERATIMSPAVDKAIKDLKVNNNGDHCSLMRSACAFLVHVCQDEHRLFYQFFTIASEQLNTYLEGLCVILYDTLRPYIIHINHLETLAEICSILRIEMLEEHVQQNPEPLEAFGKTVFQLLQDVQERLVFRAHLYLQSDILNYSPSGGDLAYPEKLEMMEKIALSLQEPQSLKRSDSKSSLASSISSAIPDNESVAESSVHQKRFLNSPADLHGMWYPTVRRTLVCLSRLYRCVDRPIFQGLSQEALHYCIQSVSSAGSKISAAKTSIDGELFEIKHLLILREQIAPFRVDFTIKETTLDFSKVKTAAIGLLQKRKQLFSMGSNNALLEFLLDGTPQVKEHLIDSRKDVDRQLKYVCELFIKDSVQMLIGPLLAFLEKAQSFLKIETNQTQSLQQSQAKINYQLRQSPWASPQQISGFIQESQRLIKNKLAGLQRSMQLYLSNKDTEFIIFRPIRNNIINAFVRLEQLLVANGYTKDDMVITSCPTPDQISILLSSASILAETAQSSATDGSGEKSRKISKTSIDLTNDNRLTNLTECTELSEQGIEATRNIDIENKFKEEV
ncbi:conserved oligomeric Golgi complex subunit 3 [Condylostylus longicornis]|uniref:conserved oligomeric Golgi complex subunit 3 n=1 Tax=Condylostylus longicornis TaxID=2530218 RepID=UPI00244E18CA|nr:conserved oligomeric Golgi complex subunit 3 [Condylostylus longicornis]